MLILFTLSGLISHEMTRCFFPLRGMGDAKAIMVGKVGQEPMQKRLRNGRTVVLFSLGTGGIRNNRRPLDREEPHQYADRCSVQWHRVCVYPERLGTLALNHVKTG